MNELAALRQQLEEARDEAELNLLQLQQTQAELETHVQRCQQLDGELALLKQAGAGDGKRDELSLVPPPQDNPSEYHSLQEFSKLCEALERSQSQLSELQRHRQEEQQLLNTAQTMLEGQARYLEDVSLREEQAAKALDRVRLLEAEILYYLRHSKPQPSIDLQRVNRLIQLAKQASPLER